MSNLRKRKITNAEKEFVLKAVAKWARIDGRAFDEFRNIDIQFGRDWGCCSVQLGKTSVLAQVSCELQVPNSSRPREGIININLELNTMGDPNFDASRQSDLSAQLNRLLEKCFKVNKVVDLESLCIKVNERVWAFRVDVNVLNNEGNILDCASIAALAALAHFRRPDVTSDGIEFKIHSLKERDPIPTVIHHYPVYISFAIFEGGHILVDPTLLEREVANAQFSVSLNAYKEVCGLHLEGKVEWHPTTISQAINKAVKHCTEYVQRIKDAVEKDTDLKLKREDTGFHIFEQVGDVTGTVEDLVGHLDHWNIVSGKDKNNKPIHIDVDNSNVVQNVDTNTAELIPKQENWISMETVEEVEDICIISSKDSSLISVPDSEEDEVLVLDSDQTLHKKIKRKK